MPSDTAVPTALEVQVQLQRMLASVIFKRASNRASLFAFVVESAVSGTPLTESLIADQLFPGYLKDISNDVRVTANGVRKAIAAYYASHGRYDLILIGLPPGQQYRPSFRYNPAAAAIKWCRSGYSLLSPPSVARLSEASNAFVFAAYNEHLPIANAGLADAQLRLTLLTYLFLSEHPGFRNDWSGQINAVELAIAADPKYWHGHYMKAVFCALSWDWKNAQISFDEALALDPYHCNRRLWYPVFLFVIGRQKDALAILRSNANQNPEDRTAQANFFLGLHIARRYKDAAAFLRPDAFIFELVMEPNSLFRLVVAMNNLMLGNIDRAAVMMDAFEHRDLHLQYTEHSAFSGLLAVVEARRGNYQAASDILSNLLAQRDPKPEQLALAHMAVGNIELAIDALSSALDDRNPFMLLLHLWPVFDPLREHKKFRPLVAKLKLPRK